MSQSSLSWPGSMTKGQNHDKLLVCGCLQRALPKWLKPELLTLLLCTASSTSSSQMKLQSYTGSNAASRWRKTTATQLQPMWSQNFMSQHIQGLPSAEYFLSQIFTDNISLWVLSAMQWHLTSWHLSLCKQTWAYQTNAVLFTSSLSGTTQIAAMRPALGTAGAQSSSLLTEQRCHEDVGLLLHQDVLLGAD